jgi:hypothetical protein
MMVSKNLCISTSFSQSSITDDGDWSVVVWAAGDRVSIGKGAAGDEGEEEGAMISRRSSSIAISSTTDETGTLSIDDVLSSTETWVVASPPAAGTSG